MTTPTTSKVLEMCKTVIDALAVGGGIKYHQASMVELSGHISVALYRLEAEESEELTALRDMVSEFELLELWREGDWQCPSCNEIGHHRKGKCSFVSALANARLVLMDADHDAT